MNREGQFVQAEKRRLSRAERRQMQREHTAMFAEVRRQMDEDKEPDNLDGWTDAAEMCGFYYEYVGGTEVIGLYPTMEREDPFALVHSAGDKVVCAVVVG